MKESNYQIETLPIAYDCCRGESVLSHNALDLISMYLVRVIKVADFRFFNGLLLSNFFDPWHQESPLAEDGLKLLHLLSLSLISNLHVHANRKLLNSR